MYQTLLAPLDGSKRAEKILPYVEELARKFGSQVILLQVLEPIVPVVTSYDTVPLYDPDEGERRTAEAKNYLAELQSEFHKKGIEVKPIVENDLVVSGILAVAEREKADLIALASHGRTGLARIFYGSVAAGILHEADRPLLIIRAQD